MTREEREDAIDIIQSILDKYEEDECLVTEITIGDEDIKAFKMAIKALEQEPKTDIALDRYRDLQDYFSDEDVAKAILENQTEFKSWLERLKWNMKKVVKLSRKLETLEQEPVIDKIRAEISKYEGDCRLSVDEYPSCKQCTDNVFETIYGILDKYKAEMEG